ncbi:MAG: hypothetical protein H6754_09050 [Candidatus Omnitrophica bacterium]|nr:hypothetical protein [Candidatus Omnitrophota bacterium]
MIFDLRALAYLTCALFCLVLSAFVLGRHEKSPTRDAFLLQVFFSFIWQFGTYFVLTAPNAQTATIVSRFSYVGCIFLSVASYHLVVNFLSLKSQIKYVKFGYLFGVVVFFPLLLTDQLLTTAYHYSWGYWFHAGKLHPIYLIFFAIYGLAAFTNLFIHARKIADKGEQQKCRLLFWAYFLCYFSIIDFLPDYGIDVLPLGFLFVNMFLFIIWFVIKLHDFFFMWGKIIRNIYPSANE